MGYHNIILHSICVYIVVSENFKAIISPHFFQGYSFFSCHKVDVSWTKEAECQRELMLSNCRLEKTLKLDCSRSKEISSIESTDAEGNPILGLRQHTLFEKNSDAGKDYRRRDAEMMVG